MVVIMVGVMVVTLVAVMLMVVIGVVAMVVAIVVAIVMAVTTITAQTGFIMHVRMTLMLICWSVRACRTIAVR
jgi:hypothetical protein